VPVSLAMSAGALSGGPASSWVAMSSTASTPPASVAFVLELSQPNSQIVTTINDAICLGRFKNRTGLIIAR